MCCSPLTEKEEEVQGRKNSPKLLENASSFQAQWNIHDN